MIYLAAAVINSCRLPTPQGGVSEPQDIHGGVIAKRLTLANASNLILYRGASSQGA